jgi:transposase
MPRKDIILNIPGFSIKKAIGYNPLILEVHYRNQARCGHCNGKKVRKKDSFIRRVRHEAIGYRPTILQFKAYKLYCHTCQRYSNQRFPGLGKYQRATERLHNQVFRQHTRGVSQKDLAEDFKLGSRP